MNTKRKFTREFKQEAVSLVTEQNYTITRAATSLGINTRGQFGDRKLLYYKGFPGMSTPVFSVSVCSSVKIKGRDCGTINGHEESLSRTLMKDAREILVRLTDTYILYNSQICLTGSNPLSSTSCS